VFDNNILSTHFLKGPFLLTPSAYCITAISGKPRAAGGWTLDVSALPGVGTRGCKKHRHIGYGAGVRKTL